MTICPRTAANDRAVWPLAIFADYFSGVVQVLPGINHTWLLIDRVSVFFIHEFLESIFTAASATSIF